MTSDQVNLPGINTLLEKKYLLTPQRKAILLILSNSGPGEHLSAEEIYRKAKKHCPRIGLATVYRTLQLFINLSIVQYLILEDGSALYELKQDMTHYHMICLSCGNIFETDGKQTELQTPDRPDFKVTSSVVQFMGYCDKCCQKNKPGECL